MKNQSEMNLLAVASLSACFDWIPRSNPAPQLKTELKVSLLELSGKTIYLVEARDEICAIGFADSTQSASRDIARYFPNAHLATTTDATLARARSVLEQAIMLINGEERHGLYNPP